MNTSKNMDGNNKDDNEIDSEIIKVSRYWEAQTPDIFYKNLKHKNIVFGPISRRDINDPQKGQSAPLFWSKELRYRGKKGIKITSCVYDPKLIDPNTGYDKNIKSGRFGISEVIDSNTKEVKFGVYTINLIIPEGTIGYKALDKFGDLVLDTAKENNRAYDRYMNRVQNGGDKKPLENEVSSNGWFFRNKKSNLPKSEDAIDDKYNAVFPRIPKFIDCNDQSNQEYYPREAKFSIKFDQTLVGTDRVWQNTRIEILNPDEKITREPFSTRTVGEWRKQQIEQSDVYICNKYRGIDRELLIVKLRDAEDYIMKIIPNPRPVERIEEITEDPMYQKYIPIEYFIAKMWELWSGFGGQFGVKKACEQLMIRGRSYSSKYENIPKGKAFEKYRKIEKINYDEIGSSNDKSVGNLQTLEESFGFVTPPDDKPTDHNVNDQFGYCEPMVDGEDEIEFDNHNFNMQSVDNYEKLIGSKRNRLNEDEDEEDEIYSQKKKKKKRKR